MGPPDDRDRPRSLASTLKVNRLFEGRRTPSRAALLLLLIVLIIVVRSHGAASHDGAGVYHETIDSRLLHRAMPVTLITPRGGGSGRPLLVFLHGEGQNQNSQLSSGPLFAELRALGAKAPDIVFPSGRALSFWHNRASGPWGSYVIDEVIPWAIRQTGADSHRLAIGGISMGGFGALELARLNPGRFCAVGGHSAALWASPSAATAELGAFDNAADFARNDVLAAAQADSHLFGHAAVWLDVGALDRFRPADEQLATALGVELHLYAGGHNIGYWNVHWGAYLQFYADALAGPACSASTRRNVRDPSRSTHT